MESRILGFVEAMKLASILEPYGIPDGEVAYKEYVFGLIDSIIPQDYQKVLEMFLSEDELIKMDGQSLLSFLISSFEMNRIFTLLQSYKGITNGVTKS